jgi:hypothetical protein
MEGYSLVKVLEALADSKSLEIFNSIAKGEGERLSQGNQRINYQTILC